MRDTHHLLLLTLIGVPGCPERLDDEPGDDGNNAELGEACEEHYGQFYACLGFVGMSPCSEGRSGCVDGKTYDVECTDLADGSMACACRIDGEPIGEFEVANTSCEDYVTHEMFERCDFPDKV